VHKNLASPWDDFWDNSVRRRGDRQLCPPESSSSWASDGTHEISGMAALAWTARLSDRPIHSGTVTLVPNLAVAFTHTANRHLKL